MKLRINEKDTSMKYKTYDNVEKCFNILVNEKGYSKEEAQDIIDNILADYKYNPNSTDSLLRRINLVLSKDEYEKEFGITERFTRLREKETPNIEVKHEGILEVPEGKNVDDLPLSHFVNLANKKGLSKITKALNNLQVWNKNDDPKLSKWAGDMIDKLNKKLKKDESLKVQMNEDLYSIIYDYDDEEGNTYTNEEMFKGSWTDLQDLIKKMKSNGCYHIDANAISEEEDFDESLVKESIYTDMGFSNRKEYLNSLADDYGIDIQTVYDLASVLGPSEDFDVLVTELEDLMCNEEDSFKSFDQELHYDLLHYNYVVCDKDVDIFDFITPI